MKMKYLNILFIIYLFSSVRTTAQPFIYFDKLQMNSAMDEFKYIARFDLSANTTEIFSSYIGRHFVLDWDPSQFYILVSEASSENILINCADTTNIWDLGFSDETTNQVLYSPEKNYLYWFCSNYHTIEKTIKVLDLTSKQEIYTIPISFQEDASFYIKPTRSSFFSSDRNKIFLYSADSLTNMGQVWTFSINTNQILERRNLSEIGFEGADGYSLDYGENGIGIVQSYFLSPTPKSYFNVYNFETDSSSDFILIDGWAEALFFANGKYLIISELTQDQIETERYYPSGVIRIYDTKNVEVARSYNLSANGEIYTFDTFPNDIYYVLNLETEPEIYNLTKLRLKNLSPAISFPYSSSITIIVKGELFSSASQVYFNNQLRETTFLTDSTIRVQLIPGDISAIGNYQIWVNNYGSNSDTSIFSVVNTLPQTITPILECVRNNGGGIYTAFFGYNNENTEQVFIPVGIKNQFTKAPFDRGQPTIYLPGRQTNVFTVDFDGRNLIWDLNGIRITASKNSPSCP